MPGERRHCLIRDVEVHFGPGLPAVRRLEERVVVAVYTFLERPADLTRHKPGETDIDEVGTGRHDGPIESAVAGGQQTSAVVVECPAMQSIDKVRELQAIEKDRAGPAFAAIVGEIQAFRATAALRPGIGVSVQLAAEAAIEANLNHALFVVEELRRIDRDRCRSPRRWQVKLLFMPGCPAVIGLKDRYDPIQWDIEEDQPAGVQIEKTHAPEGILKRKLIGPALHLCPGDAAIGGPKGRERLADLCKNPTMQRVKEGKLIDRRAWRGLLLPGLPAVR